MAARSYVATLLLAGGLLTAVTRYGVLPQTPERDISALTAAHAKPPKVTAEQVLNALNVHPSAGAEDGAKAASLVFHDQLCSALESSGPPCPLDDATQPPRFDAVIAVFPDPIHTHLSLRFDRSVDALIAAAQDAGWYLDRQWMPWEWMAAGMESGEPGGDKDLPELVKTRNYRHGFEAVPGFISFRPVAGKQARPLVVFMVGDSPISGILPDQFRGAYAMTRRLQAPAGETKELRILGPSFTGSISSLATLLAESHPAPPAAGTPFTAIRIISPSISRDLKGVSFDGSKDVRTGRPEFATVNPAPTFLSYGMAQNCRIRSVMNFVREHTAADKEKLEPGEPDIGQNTRMALLSEDESAYGRISVDTPPVGETPAPDTCDLRQAELLHLSFPRDLSHLRSAYQKKSIWGFGGSASGGTSLALDFSDQHEELDAVTNFSGSQNAASTETIVRQTAQTLTERDIRVVMLSATDVFDELFLARMLGRLAPNLSVVVLDSDALFLHQGGGDSYSHVFIATPFPSLPFNLFWTAPKGGLKDRGCSPRIFPSESTQGAYLAAGSILVDGPGNAAVPFARRQFCTSEYTSPFYLTPRPPLWLVSIEHGGIWPLATIPLGDSGPNNIPALAPGSAGALTITPQRHHVPATLWMALFALLLLTAAHVCGSTAVTVRSHFLWDYAISDQETRRTRLALGLGLTLLAMVSVRFLIPPQLDGLIEHVHGFHFTGYLAIGVLAALAGLQAGCLVADISPVTLLSGIGKPANRPQPPFSPARTATAAVAGAVAASLFLFCSWLPWHWLTSDAADHVEFFERYRALYPFSGIAPTLPILLLMGALAFTLLTRMGRLYFVGPWRPHLPAICVPSESLSALRFPSMALAAPLDAFLGHPAAGEATWRRRLPSRTLLTLGAVAATLGLVHMALSWAAPTTLDGDVYTHLLKYLAYLVVGSLTYDLLRAWQLWRLLRSLVLRPLERTPLRRGFDRIKGISWRRVWRSVDSSPQFSYHPVRRALELASGKPMRLGLADGANTQVLHDWSGLAVRQTDEEIAHRWGALLATMAAVAGQVLAQLDHVWGYESGGVTGKDDIVSERDKHLDTPPALVAGAPTSLAAEALPAQEEFVALVYLQYVRIVLIQVRHSLFTAAASYVLLAAALTQYPIVGRHAIEIGLLLLFTLLAVTAVSVYAAINRDSILSRTTESEPGKLDFDFYIKIASYLGLPLIGLLVSQFPELASTVFSYLQPGAGAGK